MNSKIKKLLCFVGLHKWEYVYDTFTDIFCYAGIMRMYKRFRICKRCSKAQEIDASVIGGNMILDEVEKKILFENIEKTGEKLVLKRRET